MSAARRARGGLPAGSFALVLGDTNLLRPLRQAGLPVVAATDTTGPARWSRNLTARFDHVDLDREAPALLRRLLAIARAADEPPVLYYQEDAELRFVNGHREELLRHVRTVLPRADLVEDLVDKARFAALAERTGLPVPSTAVVDPSAPDHDALELVGLPAVAKPCTRDRRWVPPVPHAKAVRLTTSSERAAALRRLAASYERVIVQREIVGPETAIESYHAYVGEDGQVVAGFTGRKLRTWPTPYGTTSALTTTTAGDVASLGAEILRTLDVRAAVAKVDLKRDADGALWLLEVNPRFTLWHAVGAAAGVNLPAIVWADLTGQRRPPCGPAAAGVTWCDPLLDVRAAAASGQGMLGWVRWLARCDVLSPGGLDDPLPLLAGRLLPAVRHRWRGAA